MSSADLEPISVVTAVTVDVSGDIETGPDELIHTPIAHLVSSETVDVTLVHTLNEGDVVAHVEPETQAQGEERSLQRVGGLLSAIASPVVTAVLFLLLFSLVGGGIAYVVYLIIALARTNYYHQKDICGESNAWVYLLVHLLVAGGLFDHSSYNQGTGRGNSGDRLCGTICKLLGGFGLTAWGIFELFGVACVDELKGKLLYVMLTITVSVDIAAVGLQCIAMSFMMCAACCCR